MKNLTTVFIAALVSVATVFLVSGKKESGGESSPAKESVYERVLRTGEIRCGYVVYPPALIQDPNTRAMSGIYYDIVEEIGKLLSLKIRWAEEVTFGTLAEGLANDRYDLFCSATWPNGGRARVVDFNQNPLYYSVVDVYMRQDDGRFKTMEDLNKKDVKFSVMEGATMMPMTKTAFPDATIHALPENAAYSDVIMDVVLGKADTILLEKSVANTFMQNNPGKLEKVPLTLPVIVNANVIPFKKNDPAFASMINAAVGILHNQGTIDKIIRKYEPKS